MISVIKEKKPDVVHIQYDNHANIVPNIVMYSKLVIVTSHFGYLEQKNRWGGYNKIFNNMVRHVYPNYYHFTLSNGIANLYKDHKVDISHIKVMPNGARSELFRYTVTPLFPDRSIVVGKIESRKGQHLLQHHSDIWFVGNKHDNLFDYTNPRWLGEWDKNKLYQNLTDYGNLVLISDGEADPLVVKEALIAGLGVVVSEWAAANLNTLLPFITVIPANRINDDKYVHSEIISNRKISIQLREQIREYSKNFEWKTLVKKYVNQIHELL
jgi:glycosyltransferase involved in cell wall biosynthesis